MDKLDPAMLREIAAAVSTVGQYEVMDAIKAAIDVLLTSPGNAETSVHQPTCEIAIDKSEGAATHEAEPMAA